MRLPDQLQRFGKALIAQSSPDFLAQFVEAPALAERRFRAYQGNVLGNWRSALAAAYPVTAELVGAVAFQGLSDAYIAHHPSHEGDLNRYGEEFSLFLETSPIASTLPYLPAMAHLERALQAAYFAADAGSFDFAALTALPPEQQAEVTLCIWPGAQLLHSEYPVAAIWQAHQLEPGAARDQALANISLTPADYSAIATRNVDGSPDVIPITPAARAFYQACMAKNPLPEAISTALAIAPEFAIGDCLRHGVAIGLITHFEHPTKEPL